MTRHAIFGVLMSASFVGLMGIATGCTTVSDEQARCEITGRTWFASDCWREIHCGLAPVGKPYVRTPAGRCMVREPVR